MHEMRRKVMSNTIRIQRTLEFYVWRITVTSFDREVLSSTVWTGLEGMGWWQKCWLIFHMKTLCFLRGLCYSVQIWAKVFLNWLSYETAVITNFEASISSSGCQWKRQKRFNIVLKGWQGTPPHPENLIFKKNKAGLYYLDYTFAC